MQSTYPSTVRAVSVRDSPLAAEELFGSATVTGRAPRRRIAVSKDRRVRVEGSRKITATRRSARSLVTRLVRTSVSMRALTFRIWKMSSRERSSVERISRPVKFMD
jgi:hypothetical protein